MSGLVNKVKEALPGNHKTTSQPEGTSGPHSSRTANAADPRIDSDRDGRAAPVGGATHQTGAVGGATHQTGTVGGPDNYTYGPASTTDGPHKSNLMNKADPRVDSDRDASRNMGMNPSGTATIGNQPHTTGTTGTHHTTGTTGTHHTTGTTGTHHTTGASGVTGGNNVPEGTFGPHSSRTANAVDPRVDSDLDSSRRTGTTGGMTGTTGTHHTHGTTGATAGGVAGGVAGSHATHGTHHGTTGVTGGNNVPEGTFGPHSSRTANAVDARVDSDLDSSRRTGTTGGLTGTTGTHHTGTTGTTGGLTGTTGTHHTGTTGTTGGLTGTTGTHHTGTTGTHHTTGTTGGNNVREGTFGPHSSRAANAADPRVDSDLDSSRRTGTTGGVAGTAGTTGTHTTHGTHGTHGTSGVTGAHATGPAPNTAGPHKSDLLNKADPRVDSDLDGSKTVGGNKTFTQSGEPKDPTDAAQVPPSVLQKHVGPPVTTDDGSTHGKRHSISHQEQHRGL